MQSHEIYATFKIFLTDELLEWRYTFTMHPYKRWYKQMKLVSLYTHFAEWSLSRNMSGSTVPRYSWFIDNVCLLSPSFLSRRNFTLGVKDNECRAYIDWTGYFRYNVIGITLTSLTTLYYLLSYWLLFLIFFIVPLLFHIYTLMFTSLFFY